MFGQVHPEYEVIVVPNGCTDGTERVLEGIKNDTLRVFSLKEAHVSKARNYGAKKAEGDLLLFLDADTLLPSDALQKVADSFIEKHSVATTTVRPDSSRLLYKSVMRLKSLYLRTGLYKGCSGALLCRRGDFFAVKGYDEELALREHRDLILRLKEKGSYVCVPISVTTSMRRFEQWGLLKTSMFWITKWMKGNVHNLAGMEYEKVR